MSDRSDSDVSGVPSVGPESDSDQTITPQTEVSYPDLNLDARDQRIEQDVQQQPTVIPRTTSDFDFNKDGPSQYSTSFTNTPPVPRTKRPRTLSDAIEIQGYAHNEQSKPRPNRTHNIYSSHKLAERLIRQKDPSLSLCNNLSPEEQSHITSTLQLPPNAHIQWYNASTKVLYVLIDTSWLPEADPLVPLYQDVVGKPPEKQKFITDIRMDENLFPQSKIDQEIARAEALSRKSVANAPRYDTNLPEELMKDITLEEAIVYFPNHVLRWPGLALALRMHQWDQMFYRVAYLINVTRESVDLDRDYRHAEPLPCMLKIEKAIQEFEPRYRLADHDTEWHSKIGHEWLQTRFFNKPKVFPEQARTATLEEVASYVKNIPVEFQALPFTKRLQKTVGQMSEARITNPVVRDIFGIGRKPSDVSMTDASDAGNFADLEDNEYPEDQGPKNKRDCRSGNKCSRVNCKFGHTDEWRAKQAQGRQKRERGASDQFQAQQPTENFYKSDADADDWDYLNMESPKPSSGENCMWGAGCANKNTTCPHNHPSATQNDNENTAPNGHPDSRIPNQNDNNNNPQNHHPESGTPHQKKLAKPCTYNKKCTRADCTFAHTSPAASDETQLDLSRWCKFNPCINSKCRSCHSSPGKSSGGNSNRHDSRGGGGCGQGGERSSRGDHAGAGRGQGGSRGSGGRDRGDHRGGQGRGEGTASRGRGGGFQTRGRGAHGGDHRNGHGGGQNGRGQYNGGQRGGGRYEGAHHGGQRGGFQHGANKHEKNNQTKANYGRGYGGGGGQGGRHDFSDHSDETL